VRREIEFGGGKDRKEAREGVREKTKWEKKRR
jgi:hypothetical protein